MIPFTKMQGIGNDYIYIDGFAHEVAEPAALAPRIADRHFGVGADGLILVLPAEDGVHADVRMRMFNADGSESEMCGNGIRCVCKFARDRGLASANPMRIQTGAGVLELGYTLDEAGEVDQVTVDMGEPALDLASIPVDARSLAFSGIEHHYGIEVEEAVERLSAVGSRLSADRRPDPLADGRQPRADGFFTGVFVSMGNPHIVLFADEHAKLMAGGVQAFDLPRWGALIERHPAFPRRVNVHIVEVHSRSELTMRTWERGSGITLACGTGAAAVCVASALTNRADREVLIHLPGGDLSLRWDEKTNHVFKTGPAVEVFQGEWAEG